MQPTQNNGNRADATRDRRVSLDLTDPQDVLSQKMLETIERIESLQFKALAAVGSLLSAKR